MKIIHFSMLIVIVLLLGSSNLLSTCSSIDGSLLEVEQKLRQLDNYYADTIETVFYRTKAFAESRSDYALLELSTEMADCMIILHAAERRALILAKDIIKRYFIDRTNALNEVISENKYAIDLLVNRLLQAAIDNSLWVTVNRRKKVYILWNLYPQRSNLRMMTIQFLKTIADAKSKNRQASDYTEHSFQQYDIEASKVMTEQQRAEILPAIDDMIEEAKERADNALMQQGQPLDEESLVRGYIDSKLLDDIQSARDKTVNRVPVIDQDEIEEFDISIIET